MTAKDRILIWLGEKYGAFAMGVTYLRDKISGWFKGDNK